MRYNKNQPQVEAERRSTTRQTAKIASKRSGVGGPSRSASGHGKRISAAKRDERERRQRLLRLKRAGIIVAALAAAAFVVWGIAELSRAPIFRVRSVVVTGSKHLTREQVVALAAVPGDATLLRLPASQIERRLESEAWVASAELDRDFPSTLRIAITERAPAAVVDTGGTNLWVVAGDGVWLSERTEAESETVVVRDIAGLRPVPGQKSGSKELANAILVARGLSPELKAVTRAITAPTVDKTAILTVDDVEIFVGDAGQIAEKDRIAREILAREEGKVVYINVRVVDRPTWRGLE